jgi:hypothetical protein
MKKYIDKLATFIALVLIAANPYQAEVFADGEKKPKPVYAASSGNTSTTKLESHKEEK